MNSVVDFIRSLVSREPVVVVGAVVAAIIYVAGSLGIVLDTPTVTEVVAPIIASFIGRQFVTPAAAVE